MGRIVLFGATGFTGRLTAAAMLERGARPVLAGRSAAALEALADELGGGLEVGIADAADPDSVRALLEAGDVIVSTVGPFARWGRAALVAAIDAGASYLDSTGEPVFIRSVFADHGPPAAAAGVALLTAMGYDWVPGNLAAALALTEAGSEARSVEVGYFLTGGGGGFSGGTMASLAGAMLEPGHAFHGGRLVREPNARHLRSFQVRGRRRQALSAASSEHFAIPAQFPQVRDVDVYLGWFGAVARPVQLGSLLADAVIRVPPAKAGLGFLLARLSRGSTGGPSEQERAASGSHVVAIARDGAGGELAEVRLEGVNAYTFTAAMLAWAAIRAEAGGIDRVGALGPAQAFGVEGLQAGVADAGLARL